MLVGGMVLGNQWAQQADAGDNQNIGSVINTGRKGRVANSEAERQAFYGKALKVLA